MKKMAFLFLLLFSFTCRAQTDPILIYGEVGGGAGSGGSVKLDLNVLFRQDHLGTLGYCAYFHKAFNVPSDYQAGLLGGNPYFTVSIVTLMYGKTLFIPDHPHIRFTLQGGLGIGTLEQPENFRASAGNYIYSGSNYDCDYVRSFIAGLVLGPSAEFPLTHGFGLKLGVTSFINYYSSSAEVEGSILFGRLRYKPHHRHIKIEEESSVEKNRLTKLRQRSI